jgi:transposase-like protein
MEYVVQPGDTVSSIARDINPVDPSRARTLLVHELGSSVVVPGEHVIIP